MDTPKCGLTEYSLVTAAALIAASSLSLNRGEGAISVVYYKCSVREVRKRFKVEGAGQTDS